MADRRLRLHADQSLRGSAATGKWEPWERGVNENPTASARRLARHEDSRRKTRASTPIPSRRPADSRLCRKRVQRGVPPGSGLCLRRRLRHRFRPCAFRHVGRPRLPGRRHRLARPASATPAFRHAFPVLSPTECRLRSRTMGTRAAKGFAPSAILPQVREPARRRRAVLRFLRHARLDRALTETFAPSARSPRGRTR
jgi:hypothetical protein